MSTYMQSTGRTIQSSFESYHKLNPEIFLLIVREADKAIRMNKKKFSVKQIVGYLRWEVYLETKQETLFNKKGEVKKYKIPDQFTSRYSRILVEQFPHMKPYIEQREIRSL